MTVFLTIILVLLAIGVIVCVLMQSGTSAGLSGTIAGGAETFFGGKKKGLDELLNKGTRYLSIAFVVIALILLILE